MRHMCKNSLELKIITAFISARKLKYDVKHLTLLQSIRSHTTPNHFKLPLGIDGFICICHTNFEVEKKSGFSSYCCMSVLYILYMCVLFWREKCYICGKIFFRKWNHIMEKDYTAIFPLQILGNEKILSFVKM